MGVVRVTSWTTGWAVPGVRAGHPVISPARRETDEGLGPEMQSAPASDWRAWSRGVGDPALARGWQSKIGQIKTGAENRESS